MTLHRCWLATFALIFAMPVASAEPDQEPGIIDVGAPIEIGPDGHAEIGEIEGAAGKLAQFARAALSEQRYWPARREGKPVTSSSHVAAELLLVPVGDRFEVSLRAVRVGPRLQQFSRPDYSPLVVRRKGIIERVTLLRIEVGEDGRVVASSAISSTEPEFEKDAMRAVRRWQFDPLLVDGQPVPYQVIQPFWFHEFRRIKPVMPAFQCPDNDSVPRVASQSGCREPIEVAGLGMIR